MARERGSPAESKNCEICFRPMTDVLTRKSNAPPGGPQFWVKFPTIQSLTRVKCPGIARGGGGGWAVLEMTGT